MNARDIIKLAAKLYIDDYLKKKTTILANAEKGKDLSLIHIYSGLNTIYSLYTELSTLSATRQIYQMRLK